EPGEEVGRGEQVRQQIDATMANLSSLVVVPFLDVLINGQQALLRYGFANRVVWTFAHVDTLRFSIRTGWEPAGSKPWLLYQMAGQNEKTRPRPRSFRIHRSGSVLALVDDLVGRDPGHHGAQLLADDLDAVSRVVATVGSHRRVVVSAFGDEHLGVLAVLDALQSVAHGRTGLLVDDFRTGHVFTVLGVVGNRVVHVGD